MFMTLISMHGVMIAHRKAVMDRARVRTPMVQGLDASEPSLAKHTPRNTILGRYR